MATTIDTSNCTLATCPITLSKVGYQPSAAGNAFLAAWFGLLVLVQIAFAVRYKTWSYLFGQFCGLILEIIGYVARVKLHDNPFSSHEFLIQIVTITVAPAFLCFTIYLCLGRIVLVYGAHLSRIPYRAYTIIFVSMDVACLILQAGGAGWTQASGITADELQKALNVLKAGLGLQVGSLSVFILLSVDLGVSVLRHREEWSERYEEVRRRKMFKVFLISSFAAAILISIRSAYRIAELKNGFNTHESNAEVTYMILEGAMIGLATALLAVFHPGPVFGPEWKTTSFSSKHKRSNSPFDGSATAIELSDEMQDI